MRPPWFEATPALAAAGFATAPVKPIHPVARSLIMADTPNYAFLPRTDAVIRPVACPDLMALARHIDRQSQGQNLQLIDVEDIEYAGRLFSGVEILLLDMANEPDRTLGFAYLRDAGRTVLEPALRAARRQAQHAADQREAA